VKMQHLGEFSISVHIAFDVLGMKTMCNGMLEHSKSIYRARSLIMVFEDTHLYQETTYALDDVGGRFMAEKVIGKHQGNPKAKTLK